MFREDILSPGQAVRITGGPEGPNTFRTRLCDGISVTSNWVKNEENNHRQREAHQSGRQTGISLPFALTLNVKNERSDSEDVRCHVSFRVVSSH